MTSPGLLGRSIIASVLVAAVASVATAVLTTDAARMTAEREQVRVATLDEDIIERLEAYGRSHPRWSRAQAMLDQLASSSDRAIVVTDVDGNTLVSSGSSAGEGEEAVLDAGDPTAVLDPMADILSAARERIPTTYDALALPEPVLAAHPGGDRLRAVVPRGYGISGVCLDADPGADPPRGLPDETPVLTVCGAQTPMAADLDTGRGALGEIGRLQNVVATEELACLGRRGVPATRVWLLGAEGSDTPELVTVHLPRAGGPDAVPRSLERAWADCATAVLTRQLAPLVAPRAVLYVSETREVQRGLVDRIGGTRILAALAVILVVAVAASLLASRRVLRPVRRLTAATQDMAAGRLATRVDVRGHDEVARLGRSFNEMAQALADADDQRRRMVSDVAHELRTPLSNLRGYLEAGNDGVLPRDDAWNESLLEEAILLQHIVDDLAVLAQADAGRLALHPVPADVVATVDGALLGMRAYGESRGVALERTGVAEATVVHDPVRIRQVVSNLLSNAVRHSPEGAVVTVHVEVVADIAGDDGVRLTVLDRGDGIPEHALPHVFERFFRADPSRARETGGSGLGLAIVHQLVVAHGGTVAAGRRDGGGAVFVVWLPADTR